MELWRICKKRHLKTTLSGIGAEIAGGRWNHKDIRMVYTSQSLSLALLEISVHLNASTAPTDLWWSKIRVPDSVSQKTLMVKILPREWKSYPAPSKLQDIGSDWLVRRSSLLLIVPSVVNQEENNVLINPHHPQFKKVKVVEEKPFRFDLRMFKS